VRLGRWPPGGGSAFFGFARLRVGLVAVVFGGACALQRAVAVLGERSCAGWLRRQGPARDLRERVSPGRLARRFGFTTHIFLFSSQIAKISVE